ncbi:MAG TPA: TonB-dependent receptor, partial [Tahibacter sp.]|uniref:TonB-dependent receptor n=1 Tax=Tahibacter sp. TaxID=2056211 RepID=UPI002BC0576D
ALLAGSGWVADGGSGGVAVREAGSGDEQRLSTIVVTGEKIDRPLHETTTAVSVLRDDATDSGQTRSVYDLAGRVPNVITNAAGLPSIRGVAGAGPANGVFSFISGARPRISTSVDGAAETWSGQRYVDAGLWDVEQVEVLRGPQSTTQGRNTIAGAIVVNTKDPTFDREAAARAGYENEDGKALLAGMISGPLSDDVAFRVAAESLRGHGFIEYVDADWPWDPSQIRRYNLRGKLLWKPRDLPGLSVKFTLSRRDQKGEYLNTVDGDDLFAYRFHGIASNTRYQDSSNTTATADAAYAFSDAWSGHFLYSRGDYSAHFQESGTDRFSLDLDETSDTLEARFVHAPRDSASHGVIGAYYYRRAQDLLAAPDGFVGDDHVTTAALFGDGTLALGERWKLLAGGRFERERQERDVIAWPGRPWQGRVLTDISDPIFLPKLGASVDLAPATTLSLTGRKGYNAGGGSIDWITSEFYEYEKEEVETYELGLRSQPGDGRLQLAANLFHSDYDGYQALLDRRFVNVPRGRSRGAEFEATARLSERFELNGSVGWLDTEVTRADAANPQILGNEFNNAPHLTASLGFKAYAGEHVFFGAQLNRVGRYFSEIDNDPALRAGGYTLANIDAGYETTHCTVRAYVRNLTNEDVLYYRTSSLGQVGAPRTFGVIVDWRY